MIVGRHLSLTTNQPESPATVSYDQYCCCARAFLCNAVCLSFARTLKSGLRRLALQMSPAQIGKAKMKQLSRAENAQVRRKFRASIEARDRTKIELINAARAAENDAWPEYLWHDGTEDAWFHRKSAASDFIKKRGGFSNHVVNLAITDPDWETKETVAAWLRRELKLLRDAEAKLGTAPVRRGRTLSRIDISEIAIELLECIGGQSLVCLFQELLDVDRHRRSLSDNFSQLDKAAEIEAIAQLQGHSLGVRTFAKQVSVSPSTVTRWRKARSYCERVEFHKHCWGDVLRGDYFEQIKNTFPQATDAECFRRAFQMYVESLPHRRGGRLRSGRAARNQQ